MIGDGLEDAGLERREVTEFAVGEPLPGDDEADDVVAVTLTLLHVVPAGRRVRVRGDTLRALTTMRLLDVCLPDSPDAAADMRPFRRDDLDFHRLLVVRHRPLATFTAARALPAGTRLRVRLGSKGGIHEGPRFAGMEMAWQLVVADRQADGSDPDDPDAWRPVSGWAVLRRTTGRPTQTIAWRNSAGRVSVRRLDALGNTIVPAGQTVRVQDTDVTLDAAGSFSFDADETLRVVDPRTSSSVLASPPPVGIEGVPVRFGEIHWHSEFSSDGVRPLGQSMRDARDGLALDFAGPADHLTWKDHYGRHAIADQVAICRPTDVPDSFVSIPTYELSGREGHANVVADDWDLLKPLADEIQKRRLHDVLSEGIFPVAALAEIIEQMGLLGRAVIIPHHTNMDSAVVENAFREDGRPFWARFDWGPTPFNRVFRLMEIHQNRGSFEDETPDEPWRIEVGGYGSSARTALARGFRVGFTGGTDNHFGWPTRSGHGRFGPFQGVTGLVADEPGDPLTLPYLFDAMFERRTFATTGPRIAADWRMTSDSGVTRMGGEASLEQGETRTFRVRLHGTAAWERVEIVSCGAILHVFDLHGDAALFDAEWQDARHGRPLRDCYYYVRARQVDGHCVWLSPIWTDLTE